MKPIPFAAICGVLAMVLGLELISGWLLHIEAMVKILPSSNSVSFNTAVAFVLAGVGLTLGHQGRSVTTRRVLAWILIIGAVAVLFENIFDVALGLDWESLHRTVADGSPRPGRVAPNTCVALILIGLTMETIDRVDTAWRRRLVAASCVMQILLCTSGVFGLLLDPTLMFGWYNFNRMAAPTAFGIAVLTLGLYLAYHQRHPRVSASSTELGRRILFTGTVLLLAMGLAGGLSTLVVFANYQQKTIERQMQSDLGEHIQLLQRLIDDTYAQTGLAASDPVLMALLEQTRNGSIDSAWQAQVQAQLIHLQEIGFSGLTLEMVEAAPAMSLGTTSTPAAMRLKLAAPSPAALLWQDSHFALQITREIVDTRGVPVARLSITRSLEGLTAKYLQSHAMGPSGEVVLCGTAGDTIACFPSRLHAAPNVLLPGGRRGPLPIDAALAGQNGIRAAIDYRGRKVVAAYAPVGATGFGVVSKVDAAELYDPINLLLVRAMMVLTISLVIGVTLLRRQITPVIASLVTLQRRARENEDRAQRGERRLHAITDNLPALISYIDKDGVYRFANKTYEKWFNRPVAEILGKTAKEILEPEIFAVAWPPMQAALAGKEVSFDRKTDSTSPFYPEYVSVTYIPEFADDGTVLGINVLALDTTDRHHRENDLAGMAYTDSLTSLPNRRLFGDRLEQALARSKRTHEMMALLYLDIDHFKTINDTLGHDCGDLLLRDFANRLRRSVRAVDTVARLGGDEFTIIMESLASAGAAGAVAEKILAAVATPFSLDGKTVNVSTSIGIAFFQQGDITGKQYLQQSDAALYAAKAEGRNRYVVFSESLVATATDAHTLPAQIGNSKL